MRSTLPRLTEDAASEVAQVDVALVERQKERYEARLGYWEQRAQEIAGIRPKSTQGEVTVRISTMSPEARRETERTDLPALQKDAERFGARLAFWRERSAQLKRKE